MILRSVGLLDRLANLSRHVGNIFRAIEQSPPGRRSVAAQENGDRGVSGKTKRVLLADDSLELRELERELLRGRGYEVELAVDGIDAWNAIRNANFDLLLTDMDMPLVDGLRLTRLVREHERFESLPILIVFERYCDESRRLAFEAGADYYVIKDGLQETLWQTVASLIGPSHL